MSIVSRATCVYIEDSLERLTDRILASGIPAFLRTDDILVARERFAELFAHRTKCYRKVADVTVDVEGLSLEEAENAVVEAVKEFVSGGK